MTYLSKINPRTNDRKCWKRTTRHHTFFEDDEALQAGDYFQKERKHVMVWSQNSWLEKYWKLDKDKLWVSVFTTDDDKLKNLDERD